MNPKKKQKSAVAKAKASDMAEPAKATSRSRGGARNKQSSMDADIAEAKSRSLRLATRNAREEHSHESTCRTIAKFFSFDMVPVAGDGNCLFTCFVNALKQFNPTSVADQVIEKFYGSLTWLLQGLLQGSVGVHTQGVFSIFVSCTCAVSVFVALR